MLCSLQNSASVAAGDSFKPKASGLYWDEALILKNMLYSHFCWKLDEVINTTFMSVDTVNIKLPASLA